MKHSIAMCFVLIMMIAGGVCAFPVISHANDQPGEVFLDSVADRTAPVTAVDTAFTAADGKPYRLIMTGLRESNQAKMVECLERNCFAGDQPSLKIIDESFVDAEKWNDIEGEGAWDKFNAMHCWAASTSNIMWLSGWAARMTDPRTNPEIGFASESEDEVFDYISSRFFDTGGDIDAAIDWFFMGEHFSTNMKFPASLLGEDENDGRLKTIVSSNFQKKYDLAEDPAAIEQLCRISPSSNERAVFAGNIGSLDSDGNLDQSGHAITIIGIIMDPAAESMADRYKAIILADSDNDASPTEAEIAEDEELFPVPAEDEEPDPAIVSARRAHRLLSQKGRPNSYTVYGLQHQTDTQGRPYWAITGYNDDGSVTALYEFVSLAPYDEELMRNNTETEGSKDITAHVDLTLDEVYTTSSKYAPISPYTEQAIQARRNAFEAGKAVNLNYFIGNRAKVGLDTAYDSGNRIKIEWQVTRDTDNAVIAESEQYEDMEIAAGAMAGGLIELNQARAEWDPGDYTVSVRFNTDKSIPEAYYLNNHAGTAHFKITERKEPTDEEKLLESMLQAAKGAGINTLAGMDDWTIAVYMNCAGIESGTEELSNDLSEMLDADLPDNVNLLVMTGGDEAGTDMWHNTEHAGYVKPAGTQIWQITDDNRNLLYTFDSTQDMSDGKTAERFLKFAAEYAQTGHMIAVFRGKGIEICGAGNENGYMLLHDLDKAIDAANAYRRSLDDRLETFDLVVLDAGFSGSADTAYALRDSALFMVGSEDLSRSAGLNYVWIEELGQQDFLDTYGAEQKCFVIGKHIVDTMPCENAADDPKVIWEDPAHIDGNETLAVYDLYKMDSVMSKLGELGSELLSILNNRNKDAKAKAAFDKLMQATADLDYICDGRTGQVDIYLLARAIADAAINDEVTYAAEVLMDAAGTTGDTDSSRGILGEPDNADPDDQPFVRYRGLGSKRSGGIGISVFFPGKNTDPAILDARANGSLAFDSDDGVGGYVAFVNLLAKLQKESAPKEDSQVKTSISGAKIKLSKYSYVYNGKVRKPSVKTIGGKYLKKGSDYTVKYSVSSPKNVGRYTVTVTGIGKYKGTAKSSFRILPKGTSLRKLSKARKAVKVVWKKQSAKMAKSRISGYQIRLATNSKFTKNKKTVTVKGYKKTSRKITKLKGGKKYYVKIRTYKTVGGTKYYSPWSKAKTVRTKR